MAQVRLPQPKKVEFIVSWPGDTQVALRAGGEVVQVPPRNVVAQPGRGKPWRFPSATDASGRPLPGTVVLHDLVRRDEDGRTIVTFNATEFVDLLGEIHKNQPNDGVFGQGLVIVESVAEALEAQQGGRELWLESRRRWALEAIQALRQFREKWLSKNGSAAPRTNLDDDAELAAAILAELGSSSAAARPSLSDERLAEILKGNFAPEAVPAPAKAVALNQPDDAAGLGFMAYREAKAAGLKLSKAEIEALLDGDEKTLGQVLEQLAAKKGGEPAAVASA